MTNPIKDIIKFNQDAGLLEAGYDDFLEASFQVEEALEGFAYSSINDIFGNDPCDGPKELSRHITKLVVSDGVLDSGSPTDVERLDKACDAVVFAVGSMAKLGLNHHQITRALSVVTTANATKLGMSTDSHGKLLKPADFVGPEAALQEILNERSTNVNA